MSHEGRAYRRHGVEVVRISGYGKDGFTVLLVGRRDEPDRFLTEAGAMPLAGTRRALAKLLGQPTVDVAVGSRTAGLLRDTHSLRSRRWMSFRRIDHALDRKPEDWRWSERALTSGRLDFLWDLTETLGLDAQKERLRRGHPLGEIAELSHDDFDDDRRYANALSRLDLRRARDDALEILRETEKRLVVRR